MSREAMKMALEALQKIYIAPEHEEYIRVWWPACEQALTALRQALVSVDDTSEKRVQEKAKREHEPSYKEGKMPDFRTAAQQGITCNIDPKHPMALVPTPELSSITCQVGGKLWCVMHKLTGTLLHIRINDADGNLLFTAPDNLDWWIGRDEAQAKAQAAALGDDFVAAFFVCTGEGDNLSPTLS